MRASALLGRHCFHVRYAVSQGPPSSMRTSHLASTAAAASQALPPSQEFPGEPRVGVGVVVLRHPAGSSGPEVLLIRRGKRPNKGQWSFCGGSLELGEGVIDCAAREALEETGLVLRRRPGLGGLFSPTLQHPVAFASADVIDRQLDGRLAFHYAIIEVAAVPEDPHAPLVPGDDADDAKWFPVASLRQEVAHQLVPQIADVAEEAVRRFAICHD